jgi:hypothetical protein
MSVNWSGSLWMWSLRFLSLLMVLILVFKIAVPELLLALAWFLLLLFSFVTLPGNNPPA